MLGRLNAEVSTNRDALAVLEQADNHVVGQALLEVREQDVTTNGKVRFFHQAGQVLDSGEAELNKVAAIVKALHPAAERVGA